MWPSTNADPTAPAPAACRGGARRSDHPRIRRLAGGAAMGEAAAVPDAPIALVTGANRGIGREVVRQLAYRGHTVILGARDAARGEEVAAAIRSEVPGEVLARRLDVTDPADVAEVAREAEADLGRLD